MSIGIKKSSVPRSAVENTIRRGIEFHEKFHGPVTPAIRMKISRYVIREARKLNLERQITNEPDREGEVILYGPNGRRIQK